MSIKTVCDICDSVIKDGQNAGLKNVVFAWTAEGAGEVQVTTSVRVNGKSDSDLCLVCLKKAVESA